MTLYELTGEWQQVLSMMEDPDVPEEAVRNTLEGLSGEIEEKADGYAKVMRQLQAEAEAIEKEEERLNDRRDHLMSRIVSMKSALMEAMRATGKTKFKTTLFSFGIRKAGMKKLVIDHEDTVPDKYWVQPPKVIDRKMLKEDLTHGDMPGVAHLEQSEYLSIR